MESDDPSFEKTWVNSSNVIPQRKGSIPAAFPVFVQRQPIKKRKVSSHNLDRIRFILVTMFLVSKKPSPACSS